MPLSSTWHPSAGQAFVWMDRYLDTAAQAPSGWGSPMLLTL